MPTMSSAPHEPLAITIEEEPFVPGETPYPPLLSPFLTYAADKGLRVEAVGFTGPYILPPDIEQRTEHIVHLVAGSGSVPNFSILKDSLRAHRKLRHTFLYSNKTFDDIAFREKLAQLEQAHPDRLRVVHLLTRETDAQRFGGSCSPGPHRPRASRGVCERTRALLLLRVWPGDHHVRAARRAGSAHRSEAEISRGDARLARAHRCPQGAGQTRGLWLMGRSLLPENVAKYVQHVGTRENAVQARLREETARLPQAGMQISATRASRWRCSRGRSARGVPSRSAPSPATRRCASPKRCRPTASCGVRRQRRMTEHRPALLEGGRPRPTKSSCPSPLRSRRSTRCSPRAWRAVRLRLHRRRQERLRRLLRALPQLLRPGGLIPIDNMLWGGVASRRRGPTILTPRRRPALNEKYPAR